MRRPLWIPWRWWRRATQFALLVLFLWLFRRTEYTGVDQLPGGENLLFRLDPLAAAAAMLGARQVITAFWPALAVLGLTILLGRFFCGWVCPLGTLLDYFQRVVRIVKSPLVLWQRVRGRAAGEQDVESSGLAKVSLCSSANDGCGTHAASSLIRFGRATRYFLLFAVLAGAVFAYPLVGLVHPFSLLVRGMTFSGDPMLYRGVDAAFGSATEGWAAETLQPFVKKHLLPFQPMVFQLAGTSAALLAIVFALEFVSRRFWCRYLCPSGALFGLLSRRPLVRRVPAGVCKGCAHCATICRMDAIESTSVSPDRCTLCMDCVDFCPKRIANFRFAVARAKPRSTAASQSTDLSRRAVLAGIAAGAAIPATAFAATLGHERSVPATLLRPPGAGDERTFLNQCIRCGECMKVCPTNVLQPTLFEAGLEGMFSPHMAPRFIFEQTYCEYSCTLCGQVCPTGAIPRLTEDEKHARPTGVAYFDHTRCLPWAEKTPCVRCEEMCPVPDKAIKILNTFKTIDKDGFEVEIQQPYVVRDLCVGCGICESNCTIPGVSAIRLQRLEAPDPGTEFLLKSQPPTDAASSDGPSQQQ